MSLPPATRPAVIDEMVDGRGGLRPHWRTLVGAFTTLGEGGLAERVRRLHQAFEEEGVTSVLPGEDPDDRAWRCDPVPLPITAAEFAVLESGLVQRARVLEAALVDIYGRQTLLSAGVLPPALIYSNQAFLRPCQVPGTPRQTGFMQFYAADLIRGPDGTWRVLADRTAGAAGIGYARENRRLLAQVLPEVFRPIQVRQLRPFFELWQDSLQRMAPPTLHRPDLPRSDPSRPGRRSPAVALLTPGTGHPQWFEHMFLSRELSCALVESGDLTVRGGALFVKTLKGLEPVDVLLRRMEGRLIDPLELTGPSGQGVAGLLDAARGGAVRISNDPGTGVMEAPGLAAFLPAMALHLLEEQLKLPSVPTLWLGEPRARDMVAADLAGQGNGERWLIRPATDGRVAATTPARLDEAARKALAERIAARPWDYAATAFIPPSVAPCAGANGFEPQPVVLRMFLHFDGSAWRVMEGGLARVLDGEAEIAGGLPRRGLSKDVWVLSDDRRDIVGPTSIALPPLPIRRTAGDLPSRVADNLFWLGRYVERLEASARLVRAIVARLNRGAQMPRELTELRMLTRCLVQVDMIRADEAPSTPAGTALAELLLRGMRESGQIVDLFGDIARLTELVRDRLTGDMYAAFTHMLREAREEAGRAGRSLDRLSHAMLGTLRFSSTVAGVAAENMVRGGGWLFLDLGRRIERARTIAGHVADALDQPPGRIDVGLRLALELCDSVITYRHRYLNVLQPEPVLDLVLADAGNPRGLAFQLGGIRDLLERVAGAAGDALAEEAAALLTRTNLLMQRVTAAEDQAAEAVSLPHDLHAIAAGVAHLSDRVTRRYFALLPMVQTLGTGTDQSALRGAA